MICILKPGVTKDKQEQLIKWLKSQNLGVHISEGETHCVLGLIGDTSKVDGDLLESLEIGKRSKKPVRIFCVAAHSNRARRRTAFRGLRARV